MRNLIFISVLGLLLTSCLFGDNPHSQRKLTKDFWLNWWEDTTDQHIMLSDSEKANFGWVVIEPTIFAVGFDDNFIIAKQQSQYTKEIQADSLKPYNAKTYFYIIDIRNYEREKKESYNVYALDNEQEFINKRMELGVSKNLTFTINNDESK